MQDFDFRGDELHAESVALSQIAEAVGTPCFVYSRAGLERNWRAFDEAAGKRAHQICYAVKANGNLAVLNVLARLGSGFDVVSGGELKRVIAAGGAPDKCVFSGVGKERWEIELALEVGVACFNIESEGELERISRIAARAGKRANVAVRVNPDVDAKTHAYISTGLRENKFGLAPDLALAVYRQAAADDHVCIHGAACHIGSQLTELAPFEAALSRLLVFLRALADAGIQVDHIDFGGGLGVCYTDETPPSPAAYWRALETQLAAYEKQYAANLRVTIEPGRAIAANAGVLLARVNYLKLGEQADFCIIDAGMNDLIRPVLYRATQEITPVVRRADVAAREYDVVGPICESADFLGKRRSLRVRENDLLAIQGAGAYAAVMGSNYNARAKPAEVMVDGARFQVVRAREAIEDLFAGESVLSDLGD